MVYEEELKEPSPLKQCPEMIQFRGATAILPSYSQVIQETVEE